MDSDDDLRPEKMLPMSQRPEWSDVVPIPQDDGPNPVVPIAYKPEFEETMNYFRAIYLSDERSPRVLQLTHLVILLNPGNYTVTHFVFLLFSTNFVIIHPICWITQLNLNWFHHFLGEGLAFQASSTWGTQRRPGWRAGLCCKDCQEKHQKLSDMVGSFWIYYCKSLIMINKKR